MATTLKSLVIETQLTTSAANLIESGASEKIFIGKLTFTNTSASDVEVTVWRLNSTTTATTGSGGNWLVKRTIPAGKVWICDKVSGHILGNSQVIKASAGTASVINADASGTSEV